MHWHPALDFTPGRAIAPIPVRAQEAESLRRVLALRYGLARARRAVWKRETAPSSRQRAVGDKDAS